MENTDSKLKLPVKRIISNNIFFIKLINRSSKTIIFWTSFWNVLGAVSDFLFYTLLLRFIINTVSGGGSFKNLVILILISFSVQLLYFLFNCIYYHKFYELQVNNIQSRIYQTVFKKAIDVDLECYENPEFYDKVAKALNECTNRIYSVIGSVNMLFYRIVNFSANFALLASIDPMLFVFALIPLAAIPMSAKINKWGVARTNETNVVNRHRDYAKRAFYLSDYAKELRLTNMPNLLIKTFKAAGEKNYAILKKLNFEKGVRYNCIHYVQHLKKNSAKL